MHHLPHVDGLSIPVETPKAPMGRVACNTLRGSNARPISARDVSPRTNARPTSFEGHMDTLQTSDINAKLNIKLRQKRLETGTSIE
jgi:hypothetical protein